MAPHHCSWHFFCIDSPTEDAEASKKSLHLLECKREGAFVIASSKPIKDDDDDPPCWKAKLLYENAVGKDRFLCTGDTPDQPIKFIMTAEGPQKVSGVQEDQKKSLAVVKSVSSPRTYG